MKKAKARGTARKSGKKGVGTSRKPVDLARVRENITNLVGRSASKIAIEVIKIAETGQLAPARYLFEVAGLYPVTEEIAAGATIPQEGSLAHTLLRRMGLPIESVIRDEDSEPALVALVTSDAKVVAIGTATPIITKEDSEEVKVQEKAGAQSEE